MSFVLAGLLQGVGQGIQKQGAEKAAAAQAQRDNDFQIALENLRAQNDVAKAGTQADLNDRNTQREYGYKDSFEDKQLGRDVAKARVEGDIRKDVDNNASKNDRATALALESARSSNDITKLRVAAEIDRESAAGLLDRVEVSSDGTFLKFYKDGRVVKTDQKATDREINGSQGSGGSALFPELAETPAVQAASAPASRTQAPKPAAAQGGKTMTQADIQATAKARGITPAAAKLLLEELGYRLKS